MRRFLLDTHVVLWWLTDDPALGEQARSLIADARNEAWVSAASAWEMSIKAALGKLEYPEELEEILHEEGFELLPVTFFHGLQAGHLPAIHHDPFDRMLVAQARAEGLELMTLDSILREYGIKTVDARR